MAVDDVYAITVISNQLGSQRLSTFHVKLTDEVAPTSSEFNTLAIDFKEIHRPYQNTSVTYQGWRARQVRGSGVVWPDVGNDCTPEGGLYFEGNFSTSLSGVNAGEALPPQCALVTTLRTAEIGRRKRGRIYGYGWSEADQASGVFGSTLMTNITTNWGVFTIKYAPPTPPVHFQLGVWSFATASGCVPNPNGPGHLRVAPSNEAAAFTNITSTLPRNTVYTQRRRVTGVGR